MRVAAISLVPRLFCSRPPNILSTNASFPFVSPQSPIFSFSSSAISSDPAADDTTSTADPAAAAALLQWGCTPAEVSTILRRCSSLPLPNIRSVHDKLEILNTLGARGPDLVKILIRRPLFLSRPLASDIDRRLEFLRTLFPSDPRALLRAVVCNPSLLTFDVDAILLRCADLYERIGIPRPVLGRLLFSRPTIIPCSSLDDDKLDLIRRIGLRPHAALYKYAVSIIAISRFDTIRSKIANFERFGLSEDEVLSDLFARYPSALTLSVDKIQRNMTYVLGIMKLPVRAVIEEPKLLSVNLDRCLKPRFLIWRRLQEVGLKPRGKELTVVSAMRMREQQFLKAFIKCHENEDAKSLMELYNSAMVSRRLAESSKKKIMRKAFPY
ncbi:hypothetical protein KFK09_015435 [Dendrobium nobile]|uniref:Uncharacterized protein n=1 Tax=Dendrobium nobile TaxID=94219 RepID=A0A8T3B786_DENNO|nr:hypothetical protein KFK09_015435 [Dendrobium nobile]